MHAYCNAPTGVKGQTLAKGVRLLGKSTGSYGEPEYKWLVLRWTSKLGHCLTRQSKRSCSEAITRRLSAISLRLSYVREVPQREQRVECERGERGSLRRGCDTLT